MNEDKLRNQIPIFRFLNKHKWRIILPILVFFPYWVIPFYFAKIAQPAQSFLFVTSARDATPETLNQEVAKISEQLQSDDAILGLIKKYDLFAKDRRQGTPDDQLILKMRGSMVVDPEATKPPGGVNVYVWVRLWNEEPEKTVALFGEITNKFESRPDLSVTRSVAAPELGPPPITTRILIALIQLSPAMFCSLILIFIWEIPFLFYSKKTQEMVFDPIRSDWQCELSDPGENAGLGYRLQINIRYSFAFVGAVLAKSPIGELFEFTGKLAR